MWIRRSCLAPARPEQARPPSRGPKRVTAVGRGSGRYDSGETRTTTAATLSDRDSSSSAMLATRLPGSERSPSITSVKRSAERGLG